MSRFRLLRKLLGLKHPCDNHAFTDEDRKKAHEIRLLRQEIRETTLKTELQDQKRLLEKAMRNDLDIEELFSNMIMSKFSKSPQLKQFLPDKNKEQIEGKRELSDNEVEAILTKVPKAAVKKALLLPNAELLAKVSADYPMISQDSVEKVIVAAREKYGTAST